MKMTKDFECNAGKIIIKYFYCIDMILNTTHIYSLNIGDFLIMNKITA